MKKISRLYILIIILPFIIGCSENKITDYEDVKEEETENKEEDPEDNNIPVVWTGLRVDGRYLRNDNGEIVNLHGFAQTYSPYFNNSQWTNYNVNSCVAYNKRMINEILAAGWKMNFVRMHMDPYWSTTPGCTGRYEGHECFNETRFRKYLDEVFVPMAEYAVSQGLYVVMRPPGVCPEEIAPGDDYNDYLILVWDIVSKHPKLKNNSYIMFELANEPVRILGPDGTYGSNTQGHFDNLTIFCQSIVDVIRKNCQNILWIPGLGWQSQYSGFANNPVKGENIGYAVHVYPGWFNSGEGFQNFQSGWDNQVKPVADFAPIMITEMDWAPEKYNASWGKGITGTAGGDGFGANFKYIVDNSGNVSWLLFTECHLLAQFKDVVGIPGSYTFLNDPEACPWPVYHWYKEYADGFYTTGELTDIIVEGGISDNITMLTGSSKYLIIKAVYSDGAEEMIGDKADYHSTESEFIIGEPGKITALKDGESVITISYTRGDITKAIVVNVRSTSFPLTNELFNPSIWETGTFDEATGELVTGLYGFGGWKYNSGIDLSEYKYLIAELDSDNTCSASFRLFDKGYWEGAHTADFGSSRKVSVDLHNMYKEVNGVRTKVDPSSITIVGFWTTGNKKLIIKDVYLSK